MEKISNPSAENSLQKKNMPIWNNMSVYGGDSSLFKEGNVYDCT